jgi:hypothetical protein
MGGPSFGRKSMSPTLGHPASHRRRCQGKAATGFQWGRPEPGCSSNTSLRDAGAINHRRAAYPGGAQESPGGCRGPTGRKRCLPKAGLPLGASRHDFPIHAGSLGPHRAYAQHSAYGPGSPRQRAPSPQPSSPPRREGAPRLAPQAWGTLQQREDRSPSPKPPGPQAFSRAIRRASFPTRFRTPTTITKYSRETRSELWLADYRLACHLGGTNDDNLIIRNLPLFLSDTAQAGWSTCLQGKSPTGTTWSKPSPATSRARTCALGTPGISEAAASSRESLSGNTSGDSRSSAPSCPTSPTRMSSTRSSPAPPVATW